MRYCCFAHFSAATELPVHTAVYVRMLGFVPAAIDASAQLPARSRTLSAFAQCRASLRPTYNTRARPSTQRGARVGPAKRVAREREAMGDHGDPQASERLPTLIAFDLVSEGHALLLIRTAGALSAAAACTNTL